MKTFIITFLFIIALHSNHYAQTIIVAGKPSTIRLIWDELTGGIDKCFSFGAFTSCIYIMQNRQSPKRVETMIIESYDVILQLDQENRWLKKRQHQRTA